MFNDVNQSTNQLFIDWVFIEYNIRQREELIHFFYPVPITAVEGVLSKQALLPCDITPIERDDAVHMVLWFKEVKGEVEGEPLYR